MDYMKAKLNVYDRLLLIKILPPESSVLKMRIIKNLIDNTLLFSNEEIKKYEIKEKGNGETSWNKKGLTRLSIEFSDMENDIIVESLKKLNREQKINIQLLDLYDYFVDEKKNVHSVGNVKKTK